jgi:signal transduction protein with GAF and PtsI domain
MSGINDAVFDPKRLAALEATGLLDTPAEEAYDQLSRLACAIARAPLALVSLVDHDRQFLKSCIGALPGLNLDKRETPLSHSFCRNVVKSGCELLIEDARLHPLTRDNPMTTDHGVVAYAGFPLVTPSGQILGTLCVLDSQPRRWSEEMQRSLSDLAAVVSTMIEYRAAPRARPQPADGASLAAPHDGEPPRFVQAVDAYLMCLGEYRRAIESSEEHDVFAKEAHWRQRVLAAEGEVSSALKKHLEGKSDEAASTLAAAFQDFLAAKQQQTEAMIRFQRSEISLDHVERAGALTMQLEQALRAEARKRKFYSS